MGYLPYWNDDTPGGMHPGADAAGWNGDKAHRTSAGIPPGVWLGNEEEQMKVDEDAVADVVKRLRRAEGQIRGVIAMLEAGRDCADVVTQLSAVSRALDRAGFKVIASGLQQCMAAQSEGKDQTVNLEQMEKLFLSLA
jgi:DNA-binding FrmR family transcriptional regulator